jgi:cytochrome c biogenesis protein CcdA
MLILNGVVSAVFFTLGAVFLFIIAILNFLNYSLVIHKMWIDITYIIGILFYLLGSVLLLTSAVLQNRKIVHNNDLIEQNTELIEKNVETISILKTELEEVIVHN